MYKCLEIFLELSLATVQLLNMSSNTSRQTDKQMSVASLFAGIGGFDVGLNRAGHETLLFCENNGEATAVLEERFPAVRIHRDIRTLGSLPRNTDLVTAGFPCQDLSQAGRTAGIYGNNSGLVREVFRLIEKRRPPFVLFENVPFMLRLNRGQAMEFLTTTLDSLGYEWAYRVVDSRSFGMPQRRPRVFLLASNTIHPADVLLVDDAEEPEWTTSAQNSYGFYWTEGNRGIGWVPNAIPALKSGSTLGIPSAPAIVLPNAEVVTPHLSDAERLQGFPESWTSPATEMSGARFRWRLIGNAVNVRVSEWIGKRLARPGMYEGQNDSPLQKGPWPDAAYTRGGVRFTAERGAYPISTPFIPLHDFLRFPTKPLSFKASAGILSRLLASGLDPDPILITALHDHAARMAPVAA